MTARSNQVRAESAERSEGPTMTAHPTYKFIELSIVTDESLEATVNEWVGQGWTLDAIRFVTHEASRRPVMAFVSFIRTTA